MYHLAAQSFQWTIESWGCWSPKQLQPIRTLQTDILCEKPEEWLPFFLHFKLNHSSCMKNGLVPNKTFKVSNGAHSLITRDISCNQIKQTMPYLLVLVTYSTKTTFIWMVESGSNHLAFHKSVAEPHGNQIESLHGGKLPQSRILLLYPPPSHSASVCTLSTIRWWTETTRWTTLARAGCRTALGTTSPSWTNWQTSTASSPPLNSTPATGTSGTLPPHQRPQDCLVSFW